MNQQEAISKVLEVIAASRHTVEAQENNGSAEFIETSQSISGHYAEVMIDEDGRIDVAFGRGKIAEAIKAIS